MCFDVYTNRITDINKKTELKKMFQERFQLKNTEIKMTIVNKVHFASLNNKQYYCLDGITSLPYSHLRLLELRKKSKHFQKFKT